MNKQKNLWNSLAKDNPMYYIASYKGKNITEKEFDESGRRDYERYISNDYLINNKESIIEIGCGIGRMTKYMAKDFKEVVGFDVSGEMIKQGNKRLMDYPNVVLMETDGETLPMENDRATFVFSYLVFQHMKTKEMIEKNCREVYRVLKKGGLFKVLIRADHPKDTKAWWSGIGFNEEDLYFIWDDIGFTLVKMEYIGNYAIWLWLEK